MPDGRQDRLRTDLARLRLQASISQRDMGTALGVTHTTVRRVETGETRPKLQQVRQWLDAVAEADASLIDAATRNRLVDLAEAMHAEIRGWPELLGDDGHAQRDIAARERTATRVRNYQDKIVPGLLQTPEYARAYFELGTTTDVDGAVAERIARQRVLRQDGRLFLFLIEEAALTRDIGGEQVVAEQRDRIVSLSRLPSVEIAVVSSSAATPVVWHNFTLWDTPDGAYAMSELLYGQPERAEPQDVARLESLWGRLWSAAVHGDEAVRLIQNMAAPGA